jgi:hypothetical protein
MGWPSWVRRVAAVCSFALVGVACTASPAPSTSVGPPGILLVEPGEKVQAGPPTEELKVVMSQAMVLAENNGNDLGYPWFDATTGELVLSVVTPHGRELIDGAGITAPHRIRVVAHGAGLLRQIQDDATFLRTQGVPGAELIYSTVPDWRDNRAMIVISAPSQPLLDALTARYPADALAVQVDPAHAP